MNKFGKFIFILIVAIIIGIFVYFLNKNEEENGQIPIPSEVVELIKVTKPLPNDIVDPSQTLIIEGEARGNWYFEATFPIRIIDGSANEIYLGFVEASSDWMTENFVPFRKEINFEQPNSFSGELILQNSNPSDLPENSHELRIPLKFNMEPTEISVFFGDKNIKAGEDECTKIVAVKRTVPKVQGIGKVSISELLKGPTADEQKNGLFTSINAGVKINGIAIENETAYVDFDNEIEKNVGGSCRVSHIRTQIEATLKQFSTVKNVVISVNGRTEDILQP